MSLRDHHYHSGGAPGPASSFPAPTSAVRLNGVKGRRDAPGPPGSATCDVTGPEGGWLLRVGPAMGAASGRRCSSEEANRGSKQAECFDRPATSLWGFVPRAGGMRRRGPGKPLVSGAFGPPTAGAGMNSSAPPYAGVIVSGRRKPPTPTLHFDETSKRNA